MDMFLFILQIWDRYRSSPLTRGKKANIYIFYSIELIAMLYVHIVNVFAEFTLAGQQIAELVFSIITYTAAFTETVDITC